MRILADENCPKDLVDALQSHGYDIIWIREDSPSVKDEAILARAQDEKRIVLTFDKDRSYAVAGGFDRLSHRVSPFDKLRVRKS